MGENRNDDDPSLPSSEPLQADIIEPAQSKSQTSSPQAARRLTTEVTVKTFGFAGPLPPPEVLQGYNGAFVGCAERIVAMAERQSAHRQEIEKMVIESNCRAQSRGQWFAFVLALVVIGGGVYLLA